MLKIAVYDSGYGGELFADYLEERLPVVEVIRVIDWRNADKIQRSARTARRAAEVALAPYIGQVDLVVFANFLLSTTGLKYFRRKYRSQCFTGLGLSHPGTFKRRSLVLATRPLARTLTYRKYLFELRRRTDTLCLDHWPALIDDGELTSNQILTTLNAFFVKKGHLPDELILACSQFRDIEADLRIATKYNAAIHDGFDDAVSEICRQLKIRGAIKKKKRHYRSKSKLPAKKITHIPLAHPHGRVI